MTADAVPGLPGLLGSDEVAATAAALAGLQEPDGALPWSVGAATDTWNHVEAAMGLLVGGQVEAAERAYDWCLATQRPDGSWPMRLVTGRVEDAATETNMCAYLAVGVWHHWLVRRDPGFLARTWPAVRAGLDLVVGLQLPFGGIAWSRDQHGRPATTALVAGSASIFHALRAGLALATLAGEQQPDWELACGRLGHALREHRDRFLDKRTFSMDWYYPVLAGAVRGEAGRALLAARWGDFVVPGLGIRCVDTNPWVTGAETCELVLALDALGDPASRDRARRLLGDMQHLRHDDGSYWTGYVFADDTVWPREHTGYTSAAVLLAVDALSDTTGGAEAFRQATLPDVPGLPLGCGCPATELASSQVS